jgi:hypothetical protein
MNKNMPSCSRLTHQLLAFTKKQTSTATINEESNFYQNLVDSHDDLQNHLISLGYSATQLSYKDYLTWIKVTRATSLGLEFARGYV